MKQTIKLLLAFLVLMVSSTKVWADQSNDLLEDGLVTVVGDGEVVSATAVLPECANTITVNIGVNANAGTDASFSFKNYNNPETVFSGDLSGPDVNGIYHYTITTTEGNSTATVDNIHVTVTFTQKRLALQNSFGENVTVDFYDGGTSEPTSFDTSGKTKITSIDNSDGEDHWIVMDIKPKDGYWVNSALMSGLETVASLAPRRAPGIDAFNTVKKIGTGHKANGEGLYCYMLPKEHTIANYKFTGVKGVVIPKFDLSAATYAEATKTFTASNGAGWTADIKLDKNSWAYDKTAHIITFDGNIKVKKGDADVCELPYDGNIAVSGEQTNASATAYTATMTAQSNSCFDSSDGKKTKTTSFNIYAKEVGFTWDATSFVYNGSEQKPTPTIKSGDIIAGDVCTISAVNIAAVAPSTLTAEGKSVNAGNYTATVIALSNDNYIVSSQDVNLGTQNFSITARTVKDNPGTGENQVTVVLDGVPDGGYTYDGTDKTPAVTVKDGDNEILSTEYTIKYKKGNEDVTNPQDAGTYTVVITDNAGGNYTVSGEKTFTIKPKALTAAATAENKTYDGTATATVNGTVETGIAGQALTISGLTGTFADANVGTGKTVTVTSTAAVAVASNAATKASNYDVSYPTTTTANITQRNIEIPEDPTADDPVIEFTGKDSGTNTDIPAGGYTYDGTEKKPAVVVKDGAGAEIPADQYTVSYSNNIDAGSNAKVTVSEKAGANYKVTGLKTFSIAKKTLTATVAATNKVYDGTTTATVNGTVATGVDGQALTISGLTGAFADANVGTGKTVTVTSTAAVVAAGNDATKVSNYAVSYPATTTANITQKSIEIPEGGGTPGGTEPTLTFTNIPTGGYIYDGTEKKPTVEVKDEAGNVIAATEYDVTYSDNKDAGENTAKVTVANKTTSNYAITGSKTFSIAKKALTATVAATNKVYDGTATATVNGTVTTGVGTEALTISGLTGTFADANVGTGKTVTVTSTAAVVAVGNDATKVSNYTVSYPATTIADITQKSIEIPEGGGTPGGTEPTLTFTNIPTGGYIYDGTEKKPTVEVKDEAGNVIAATEYDVTYSDNKDAGENTAKVTVANKATSNYAITGSKTFSIAKKALTATVAATNKVYDGNTTATVNATVATGVDGQALTISGLTGAFADANVGTGKTVTVTSTAAVVAAGNTATKVSNYTVSYPATTTANITQKSIEIPEGGGTPGGTEPTLTFTNIPTGGYIYDGTEKKPAVKVKDEAGNVIAATEYDVTYSDNKDAGENTAKVTVANKATSNYTITGSKTFSIAKKALTATVAATNKVYDGTTTATVNATVVTGVDGQTLTISGLTGTFADANVGTGKTVTVTSTAAVVAVGNDATKVSNYTVSYPATTTADITQKSIEIPEGGGTPGGTEPTLTFTNIPTGGYIYDGTEKKPAVKVKDEAGNVIAATEYDVTYANNINAGTTATVTVANKENSNYAITGSMTFAIGKREVTVNGITAHDKDHDGTTAAVLVFSDVTFGNIVEGDKLTVTAKGAFADAEVGENKTVNITELVLGGASVANYLLAATGNQTTTTASIHAVGTIDRRHSNIQVVRNDNGAAVENDAYLTKMADGTYRIDHVNIVKPADATATNPVSVTIIIPATLKDPDGNTGNTYGLDNDIIQTETFVPVTDMKMPDTGEKALQIAGNHVSCNGTLVTVHTPLQLLDDYAKELSQNVAEKKVVSEVTQTAKDYWTFSSSIDVEFPADIEISIITSFRPTAACKTVLAGRSVPANEAVLLKGKQGETYQIKAIPNVPNAQDFSRNLLVPVPVHKHFEYGVGYYIMMMNTFHAIANDNAEVPSCHAVLFVKGAAAAILDIVDEADLTGISDATRLNDNDENTNDAWYDLNGRKLDKKPVTKGLYIHNGKKVVIK